jgi:cysteinyl-tRNA synthetase
MKLYDSVKKEKIDFIPIRKGEVRIYVCGPTVYDDSHLGHARSAICFDILRRVLEAYGYRVTFMKNFTDIDDKIINRALSEGRELKELTEHYTQRYLDEMAALGVKRADIEPKATESLGAIKAFISELIAKGFAYVCENGDVYFRTKSDSAYGELAKRPEDENQSRVEENSLKEDQKDFALWKSCKGEDDICFDSAFSSGRPGWHIECSAMIDQHLAYQDEAFQIDIHGGGADLLFPHHENEAAQSRCAREKELAKYWVHNGFVNINGEKMSKSLGNSFFLKDALEVYDGEVLRFYLLSTHYRAMLNFNEEDLQASKKRLDRLYRLKKRVYGVKEGDVSKRFKADFLEALSDDLNISKALAVVDELVAAANEGLDTNPKDKVLKRETIANIAYIDTVLGIGYQDAYKYFQIGVEGDTVEKIEMLLAKRAEAKKEKNFALADTLRDEVLAFGVSIMDTANGTVWEKV